MANFVQVTVGIYHWAMFRSADHFAPPEEFIPERWTENDPQFQNDNKATLQPFSYGPRNCIGRK